jgi:hypothetical protein
MPLIVVTCPECETRLETGAESVGRSGQCPACDAIFPVSVPAGGQWAPEGTVGLAVEYDNVGTMSVPVAMGACLVLMTAAALVRWVDPLGSAAAFVGVQQGLVAGVSLACLLAIVVSAAARASFGPAVLAASTWAVAATVLLFGLERCLGRTAGADGTFAPTVGLYIALGAGVLAVAGAAHAYVQYRRAGILRQPTRLCMLAAGLGAAIGFLTLVFHTGPGCEAALELAGAARGCRAETPAAIGEPAWRQRPSQVRAALAPAEPGPSGPAAGGQLVPAGEPGVGPGPKVSTGGGEPRPRPGVRSARHARAWIQV